MFLKQITDSFLGLPTLVAPYTITGFILMGGLAFFSLMISLGCSPRRERIDGIFFWLFGLVLVNFAIFRPVGLARDDSAYVNIVNGLSATLNGIQGAAPERDHVWYYLVEMCINYLPGNVIAVQFLSGFGVLIKLFVIDRLCSQRLLALLLFIPLCYLQYDLTQLRAGLAISWMMLGIYWLVRSKIVLGGVALLTNFMVHSQAIFSPALLMYKLFGFSRLILPMGLVVLIGFIYSGFYPSANTLNWLVDFKQTSSVYAAMQMGGYAGVKIFPLGYFLILAYGTWLTYDAEDYYRNISQIVSAGLFLGTLLVWFFAIIPTMQTRLFEFYAVPLTIMAGNVQSSRVKIVVTVLLAIVLYLRLELFNDWILG